MPGKAKELWEDDVRSFIMLLPEPVESKKVARPVAEPEGGF
jgi:hypothetical protein